jgi:excisionase family DNA binding protein
MEVFTVKEVAERLKTSEEMIRQYMRAKRIKGTKFGTKWMVTGKELERILTEGF